jgi:hypothetical protein
MNELNNLYVYFFAALREIELLRMSRKLKAKYKEDLTQSRKDAKKRRRNMPIELSERGICMM